MRSSRQFEFLLPAACAVFAPFALRASDEADLVPGMRIRVTAPGVRGGVLVGVYAGRTDDGLLVETDTALVTVPIDAIRRLEVSRGRGAARAALGAVLGGAGGIALAMLRVAVARSDRTAPSVLGGLGAGMLGGAVIAREGARWEAVPVTVLGAVS